MGLKYHVINDLPKNCVKIIWKFENKINVINCWALILKQNLKNKILHIKFPKKHYRWPRSSDNKNEKPICSILD